MSYEISELTAMASAEPVEMMAMKSMMAMAQPPPVPRRCTATAGGTRPAPASVAEMGSWMAVDATPSDDASENGIANQTMPPSM